MPTGPIPRWPRLVRALLAQAAAFAALLLLARAGLRLPAWSWVVAQAALAATLGSLAGLPGWWAPIQAALPFALWLRLALAYPPWLDLAALAALLLAFGGGLATRVPLYNASRDAWRRLQDLLPARPGFQFIDLGCGLGGPLAHLAAARPDGRFLGVESSPLPWLVASLRCLPRRNVRIAFGSLWNQPLAEADLVYAFLSPEPMAALWAKARKEMKPGSRLVSHSFAVPGVTPAAELPVEGRPGARLLVWEL